MNGIERYFQLNPAGSEYRKSFNREKNFSGKVGTSPVEVIARAIIKSCSRDAGEVYAGQAATTQGGLVLMSRDQDEQNVPQKLMFDQVGIVFGTTLLTLEAGLIDRMFNQKLFSDEYLEAIRGTLFSSQDASNPQVERIPEARWRDMVGITRDNKSLSVFYTSIAYEYMPKMLKDPLEARIGTLSNGIMVAPITPLGVIQRSILPGYIERYNSLLSQNK